MAPPKYPKNPAAESRDGEIGALFEKARAHENFKDARKGAQEAVNVTILGEDDEDQKVDILFKDHYKPAEYITGKKKPIIESDKTHLLLGNVDSDAFDSNLKRGPEYYQDLKKNAALFTELKEYININFPALQDPTKKARIIEMIDKTKEFAGPFDLKSFKEFCTQNKFTKAEVFGKNGLSQVLLGFSRAIEPVKNRAQLTAANFEITDTNPNPLFYRIELGIGKAGANDKDRFSIVLKSELNGKIASPSDEPEEPDAPDTPAEPAPPAAPPAPVVPPANPDVPPVAPIAPVEPAAPAPAPPSGPDAPLDPSAPPAPDAPPDPNAPPETPPEETRKLDITYPGDKTVTYTLVGVPKDMVPGSPVTANGQIIVTFTQQLVPVAAPATPPPAKPKLLVLTFVNETTVPKKTAVNNQNFADFSLEYSYKFTPPNTLKFEKHDTKPASPDAPTAGLKTEKHEIIIDDIKVELETNAPADFKFELAKTSVPKGYSINVFLPDPSDPAKTKTGTITFGKNPDYKKGDPVYGHQFWYNFSNTPGTASHLDIWKFYKLQPDRTKPAITITKLPQGEIAFPSISYFPGDKQIIVYPEANIGKRKDYTIDDQSGQNLNFEYFNEDGKQYLCIIGPDHLEGVLDIEAGKSQPIIPEGQAANYDDDIFQHYDFKITEGAGANPGTITITPASADIRETSHEVTINSATAGAVPKVYTLKIKAPEKLRHLLDLHDGTVNVTFGGKNGTFMVDDKGAVTFRQGVYMQPDDDLWTDYEVKIEGTEVTIEKRKEKPAPRLEYDKKGGTVTFITKEGDSEKRATYEIENPDNVIIKYGHDNVPHTPNAAGSENYWLTFSGKGGISTEEMSLGFLLSSKGKAVDLFDRHAIMLTDPSGSTPGIFKIYAKASADVTPREPSSPGPPAPAPATGTATKLGARLDAVPTVEEEEVRDEIAIFPFGNLIFKFPGATFERSDKENTIELKTGGESYTIEFSLTGEARFVGKDEYMHTHTISSTCDDNNECIVEIIPIEQLAGDVVTAPLAEAPPAVPEAAKPKIALNNEKDEVTITLADGKTQKYKLKLPVSYKSNLSFEVQPAKSGISPSIKVQYTKSGTTLEGFIEYSSVLTNFTGRNTSGKPMLFGKDADAPFTFHFEKGDKDALPTITLISNEETEEIAEKVTALETVLKNINAQFGTRFAIESGNVNESLTNIDADNYKENLTKALTALSPVEKEAIKGIDISLGNETKKTGDNSEAGLDYKVNTSGGLILAELKKIIGFFFVTWTPEAAKAFADAGNLKCEDDLGASNIWYKSATFDPKNKDAYTPAEGDYKIQYGKTQQSYIHMVPNDGRKGSTGWVKTYSTSRIPQNKSITSTIIISIQKFEDGIWKEVIGRAVTKVEQPPNPYDMPNK